MADEGTERREREPVGSVADETARLLEALGGWAEGLRAHDTSAYAASPDDDEPASPDDDEPASPDDDEPASPDGDAPAAPGPDEPRAGSRAAGACEQCGGSGRAGEALACQLCPVCQGIALLRTVRPETVERLADLAAALSGALRDIAAERFGPATPHPPSPPPRGQRVQDIAVEDDDDVDSGTAPTERPRRRQETSAP